MNHVEMESEARPERAIVVGRLDQGEDASEALVEIRELLRTAGVEAVGEILQRREEPHPVTYLGSGKVAELDRLVKHLDPDIVVFDDELAPRQQRALEDRLKRRVFDRTAVILDIFALHAHTAEGKVQVELAQLEYNLSRMRGMWTHLERLGAGGGNAGPGVGTRGPGESQLETDRRLARKRISQLKSKLKSLTARRQTQRSARQQSIIPKVALAGYTNAGKSTLLNAITGASVSTANRLFETLDPTTRAYEQDGRRYLITDTVGFIQKLPHQLVDAFASTLEETLVADLILVVLDGSEPKERIAAHLEAVRDVLIEIGAGDIPWLKVFNKTDAIDDEIQADLDRTYPEAVFVSAAKEVGLDELMERIASEFHNRWEEVTLLVPYTEAGILSELYEAGTPVTRRDDVDGIHASAHLPERMVGRVSKFRIDEEIVK